MMNPSADRYFIGATKLCALCLLALILALFVCITYMSWPSIRQFGWSFIWQSHWNPVTHQFGAASAMIGTLLTTLIACVFAVPISFTCAVLIAFMLPRSLADTLSRLIELMAGIPSIIYGMWGLFVLAPFLRNHVQPHIINSCAHIPVLRFLFAGLPIGIGIFTAGLVLAIMIAPLITAMMRDVIEKTPSVILEAAYAMGATRWEVTRKVVIHYARAGLFGSIILGLGRALGETMAVTFVIGNAHGLPQGLFMPGTTISATIANEFTEATGKLYPAAIIELSLILFAITFVVLMAARYLLAQAQVRGGSL